MKRLIANTRFYSQVQIELMEQKNQTFERAVEALNGYQSNAEYIKKYGNTPVNHSELHQTQVTKMKNALTRSGLNWDDITKLSVIHVTGTKGKGSTCAYTESILRQHGMSTGLYSSPHLKSVTERIKINSEPLRKCLFAQHFWEMLTVVAFHVFVKEKVDVAIVEVGIGGEYDSTNFIPSPVCCGVSSLGLDHTNLLGNTIEEIAWNKGGIFKPNAKAFTVPQTNAAINILKERAIERQCSLNVVNTVPSYISNELLGEPLEVKKSNFALGYALAEAWMIEKNLQLDPVVIKKALLNTRWPGRYQIAKWKSNLKLFLDGAHTIESLKVCTQWFLKNSAKNKKKCLIYNSTGFRNVEEHFKILATVPYDVVYFVTNDATTDASNIECATYNCTDSEKFKKCLNHQSLWIKHHTRICQKVYAMPCVQAALMSLANESDEYDVLVTGSLHLVGATLTLIE